MSDTPEPIIDAGAPLRLEVRHMTKRFGDLVANGDVELRVAPGEVHGVLPFVRGAAGVRTGGGRWWSRPCRNGAPAVSAAPAGSREGPRSPWS